MLCECCGIKEAEPFKVVCSFSCFEELYYPEEGGGGEECSCSEYEGFCLSCGF